MRCPASGTALMFFLAGFMLYRERLTPGFYDCLANQQLTLLHLFQEKHRVRYFFRSLMISLMVVMLQACAGPAHQEQSVDSDKAVSEERSVDIKTSSDIAESKNAGYRKDIVGQVAQLGYDIDRFYLAMQWLPVSRRQYAEFEEDYRRIEHRLLQLLALQQQRPDGQLSVQQTRYVSEIWRESRNEHGVLPVLSDKAIRQKKQMFQGMFMQMLRHESEYSGRK